MGVRRGSSNGGGGGASASGAGGEAGEGDFCRIVLVGDAKVGKSSLVSRAIFDKFTEVRIEGQSCAE